MGYYKKMIIKPEDCIGRDAIFQLIENPSRTIRSTIAGKSFSYHIVIPDIAKEIAQEFSEIPPTNSLISQMPFKHFGLMIEFDQQVELDVFSADLILAAHLKFILIKFGVCMIKNIKLVNHSDAKMQKNIFPDLVFHVDRGSHFSNQYSLFYRNPADPEHAQPRQTTTLIMPNAAAELQGTREGIWAESAAISCKLFREVSPEAAIDHYVVEQKWNGPTGTGEICFFDNRTVLHASYHHGNLGYPICVQYLF